MSGEEHTYLEARLRREPGIRDVRINALTGNLLVQFDSRLTSEERVLASVAGVEVPTAHARTTAAKVSATRPADPMQSHRLVQSGTRVVGSAIGLGLLAGRRLRGATGSPVSSGTPVVVAAAVSVIEGFPALREGARRHLGSDAADVLFGVATIVSLTAAGGTLGLALSGLAATRMLAEVMSRRAAWRRYEERVDGTPPFNAGSKVRLERGERAPHDGYRWRAGRDARSSSDAGLPRPGRAGTDRLAPHRRQLDLVDAAGEDAGVGACGSRENGSRDECVTAVTVAPVVRLLDHHAIANMSNKLLTYIPVPFMFDRNA